MRTGRPRRPITISDETKKQLQSIASSRSHPYGIVRRAQIILMSADGQNNSTISRNLRVSVFTICKWRNRYRHQGITGLYDELRPGRPRSITDEKVAAVINKTLHTKPQQPVTHWTVRSLADKTRLSKTTIHRMWQAFCLQPHRQRHFKLSTDPFFVEKVRDIAGLYLNPPDKALVLCVDEKSQIQALDRTQPMLPIGLGYALHPSWNNNSFCRTRHCQRNCY
jgi:putative transposase